jgi:hypothetical protein
MNVDIYIDIHRYTEGVGPGALQAACLGPFGPQEGAGLQDDRVSEGDE